MNNKSIYDIIRFPLITEKSTNLAEINKYVFKVDVEVNKLQLKKAIESIFNIEVLSVNILNVKGKRKIFKGKVGRRNNFKKAIVSINPGQKLDLSVGV